MCDIDAQAVEFATKNAELNNVVATIEKADLLEGEQPSGFHIRKHYRGYSHAFFKEYRQTSERKRHYRVVGYH